MLVHCSEARSMIRPRAVRFWKDPIEADRHLAGKTAAGGRSPRLPIKSKRAHCGYDRACLLGVLELT